MLSARVVREMEQIRQESLRRLRDAFCESETAAEQPCERTGPAVAQARLAVESLADEENSSSGTARELASSASVWARPRGSTTRSPGSSATVSSPDDSSADPSLMRWNFAVPSPSTRNAQGARSSDRQKIVLRTSNERSTSETVSDGGEASCIIVNARTRIAADQP